MSKQTLTRRAALAALGSGAVATFSGTFGFSSVSAERATRISVADDPSALLGIENVDGDPETVPVFTNRFDVNLSVTVESSQSGVEFDIGDTGTSDGPVATFTLTPGESLPVDVLGDGTIPVSVVAELGGSGGPAGTVTLSRDVEARTQGGQVDVTPNVKEAGNSGYLEFELVNEGTIDAVITGIKIRDTTNPDADRVDQKDGLLAGASSPSTQILTPPIYVEDRNPNVQARRDFAQSDYQTLTANGGSRFFAFDRFVTGRGKNAKMKGEVVYVTLYFDDGSSAEKTLDPNA